MVTRSRIRTHASKLDLLAAGITAAKSQLGLARRNLARTSRPDDDAAVVHPSWRPAMALLSKRVKDLSRSSNVLGHAVAWRIRGGVSTDERCITIFVRRKMSRAELAQRNEPKLPKRIGTARRLVGIDVVELKSLRRQALGGDSIGPAQAQGRGTLGSFAIDKRNGKVVGITAMHVSGEKRDVPRAGVQRISMSVPSQKDQPGAALIGDVVLGTLAGVDACKIELAASASIDRRIRDIGLIKGWRPVVVPGDKGTSVRMCGHVSGLQAGVIEFPFVSLPEFGLDGAILVRIPSRAGDSGAALVDPQNLVLGYLVGMSGGLRVFSPAGLVLKRLECDIPTIS